jgi:prophage antirepressor-like protein
MSATPIPDGDNPFDDDTLEILLNDEGYWFRALDVVALLERFGGEAGLAKMRQMLEMLGEEL